jgi:hypothetical protein
MTTTNTSDRSSRGTAEASRASLAPSAIDLARSVDPRLGSQAQCFGSKLKILPGVTIPLRSMLVTSAEHELLISPVGTPEEASHLGAAPLTLIAPSLLHHIHLAATIERFRPVALWAPPGLAHKHPELGPIHVFGVDAWPHGDLVDVVVIEGAPVRNEVVFFHRASKTIYTADLFFNIRHPEGFLTSMALRFMGLYGRFAAAKQWRHWVKDRAAFTRSIEAVLAWDFERIVMAHGEPVDDHAHDRFEIALRELQLLDS